MLLLAASVSSFSSEKDLYDFLWLDPDKSVYVLQNKVFKKADSFYINGGYLMGITGEFQSTKGLKGSAGYYFNEEWAFEVGYNKYSTSNNEAFQSIQSINQSIPFIRRMKSQISALAIYSPFYGKINTFNKIIYFDWNFGLGLTKLATESNALTVSNVSTADTYNEESYTGTILKTGLRVHVTPSFHLDVDYQRAMYKAPGPSVPGQSAADEWRSNSDVILSIGMSF